MINDVLKKARRYIPFTRESSEVDFGGESQLYEGEPYVNPLKWVDGWEESGALLLDSNGDKIEYPPKEGIYYILRYNIIHLDTINEEDASLSMVISKPKDTIRVGVAIMEEGDNYSKHFTDWLLEDLAISRRLKISPTDTIGENGERLYMLEGNPEDVIAGVVYLQEIFK